MRSWKKTSMCTKCDQIFAAALSNSHWLHQTLYVKQIFSTILSTTYVVVIRWDTFRRSYVEQFLSALIIFSGRRWGAGITIISRVEKMKRKRKLPTIAI